ncbi:MAG: Flp pilus assembly protein CpaB [Pseudomonadota bacterium]
MNVMRIVILAVAALAAIVAALFVRSAMQPQQAASPAAVEVREAPTERVLAFRGEFTPGQRLTSDDLYWRAWPEEALIEAYFTEAGDSEALQRYIGAVVRAPVGEGEPVTARKLVQAGEAGFMAAVLTPGMRAVAVPTSAEAGAGGFILPNDRVDVISTISEDEGYSADLVVENARVLAIDQTYSEEEDGAFVGSTATLEVTPNQARLLARAVAAGDVSLVLRSVADIGDEGLAVFEEGDPTEEQVVRVFRYGVEQRVALGGQP